MKKKNSELYLGAFVLALVLFIVIYGLFFIKTSNDYKNYLKLDLEIKKEYYNFQNLIEKNLKPNSKHFFGTDDSGRDIYSRVAKGSLISLKISIITSIFTIIVGVIIGLISGYYGGKLDSFLMMVVNIFLSFPSLLLAIAISTILEPSELSVILALTLVNWASFSRVIRSRVLEIKNKEFITAEIALGAGDYRILTKHILPNCFSIIIVIATFNLAVFILSEATLSFLGLGIGNHIPTLGNMISQSKQYFELYPWQWFFPGFIIFLIVIGFNLIGNGLKKIYGNY